MAKVIVNVPVAGVGGWETLNEYTLVWKHGEWTIKVYPEGDYICADGPDGADIDYDDEEDDLLVGYEAPYEGTGIAKVPLAVALELLWVCGRIPREG